MAPKKTASESSQSSAEAPASFDEVLKTMLATPPDPRLPPRPKARKVKAVNKDATAKGGVKASKKLK